MNIKNGDKNIVVRYLQAFLYNEYAKTIRISGIYDAYTHNKLIEYLNLPKVLKVRDVVNIVKNIDSDKSDDERLTYFFKVTQTDTQITLTSKSTVDGDIRLNNYLESLNKRIYDLVYQCGWKVIRFSTKDDLGKAVITLQQLDRKNLIPKDCISLINLNTDTYLSHFKIDRKNLQKDLVDSVTKVYTENHIIELIDCKPNTEYIITHRYDGMIPISIAESYRNSMTDWEVVSDIKSSDEYLNYFVDCGQKIIYKTSSDAKTLFIQLPKAINISESYTVSTTLYKGNLDYSKDHVITDKSINIFGDYLENGKYMTKAQAYMCHFVSILNVNNPYENLSNEDLLAMIESKGSVGDTVSYEYEIQPYTTTDDKLLVSEYCGIDNFNTLDFIDSFWKVNDKFLNYITLMNINEFSRETDILTAINMLKLLYPREILNDNGRYDDKCRELVRDYQLKNDIPFSLGYIDSETEAKMNLDIDREKNYSVG